MPMSNTLEELPLEVLIHISEALVETHRPSVASFALTSKHCRGAAKRIQYRRIQLGYSSSCVELEELSEAVARWSEILTAADCFSHVRCLRINLCCPFDEDLEVESTAFEALAGLVKQLRFLTDLTYDSELDFPASVLAVLHSDPHRRPLCRLHLKQFCLPSLSGPLYDDSGSDFEVSPEDLLLATSPCLYSIGLKPTPPGEPPGNFYLQALHQLVQGGNPHLKEVFLHRTPRPKARPPQRRPPGQKLRTWHGFGFATTNGQCGTLTSLHFGVRGVRGGVTLKILKAWSSRTDFASLRALRLGETVHVLAMQWVVDKTRSLNATSLFPSLTCLELLPGSHEDLQEIATATKEFLRCFPPLADLTLSGTYHNWDTATAKAIVTAAVDYHGQTLLRLSLPDWQTSPTIRTPGDAHEIVTKCPQLDHLAISMARSEGDATEVTVYHELGSHPLIQSINLTLDCSKNLSSTHLGDPLDQVPWTGQGHQRHRMLQPADVLPWNYHHRHLRHGHLRKALRDSALDGPLATAIFRRCAAAKPVAATTLKSMKIEVSNAGIFWPSEASQLDDWGTLIRKESYHPIFQHIGAHHWIVTPHPSDARPDELRTKIGKGYKYYPGVNSADPFVLGDLEPLFRSIWPEGTTGDCRDDWHSFPLAEHSA